VKQASEPSSQKAENRSTIARAGSFSLNDSFAAIEILDTRLYTDDAIVPNVGSALSRVGLLLSSRFQSVGFMGMALWSPYDSLPFQLLYPHF
jgi:hypothetical protein